MVRTVVFSRRGSLVVMGVIWAALAAVAQVGRDYKAKPRWDIAEAPRRLVLQRGGAEFLLVRLPQRMAEGAVADLRVLATTNELPWRVVWRDDSDLTVLIDGSAARPNQLLKIYPLTGGEALAVESGAASDPAPLRGRAQRTAGMDFPASLEELKMLEPRVDGKEVGFSVSGTAALPETFESWFRGDWSRRNHLVDLQTWVVVEQEGEYLFGLAGIAPAWLLVDGAQIMAHPAGQPYDKWSSTEGVRLAAGLRLIQVRTVCRQKIDTGLAWKRADEPGVATNMVMLTGGDLREGRWEEQNRRLHPFATATSGAAYRFATADEVFVPFELEDCSSCWGLEHETLWQGAGVELKGGRASLVARQSALPMEVALRVSAGEEQSASYALRLEYGGPLWAEHLISTRLAGVPAVCHEDDLVQPLIRIRTTAGDNLSYELATEFIWRSGGSSNQVAAVTTDRGWARLFLAQVRVGRLAGLKWVLRHQGVVLSSGSWRIMRAPFDTLPEVVSGELLKRGDEFISLEVPRAAHEGELNQGAAASGGQLLVDGCLGLDADADLEVIAWEALDRRDGAGNRHLQPLAGVARLLPAACTVLAPSLKGLASGSLATFESRLSAMTALLRTEVEQQRARVILVVPPQLEILPDCGCLPADKPCVHARQARECAAAVTRVADVHGVETVDLFSAFETSPAGASLVSGSGLTQAGQRLARLLIRNKLEE